MNFFKETFFSFLSKKEKNLWNFILKINKKDEFFYFFLTHFKNNNKELKKITEVTQNKVQDTLQTLKQEEFLFFYNQIIKNINNVIPRKIHSDFFLYLEEKIKNDYKTYNLDYVLLQFNNNNYSEVKTCLICYEINIKEKENLCCECCHEIICGECLFQHLENNNKVAEDVKKIFYDKDLLQLKCVNPLCKDGFFSVQNIFEQLNDTLNHKIYKKLYQCQKIGWEGHVLSSIASSTTPPFHSLSEDKQIEVISNEIIEKCFILSCPNCTQAFESFDGCFVLRCNRCKVYFCAWCLEYNNFNNDKSHKHVSGCKFNIKKGDVFNLFEIFEMNNVNHIMRKVYTFFKENKKYHDKYLKIMEKLKPTFEMYNISFNESGNLFLTSNPSVGKKNKYSKLFPPKPYYISIEEYYQQIVSERIYEINNNLPRQRRQQRERQVRYNFRNNFRVVNYNEENFDILYQQIVFNNNNIDVDNF